MDSNLRSTAGQGGAGLAAGKPAAMQGWKEILLASLPFLFILLLDLVPRLLVASGISSWEDPFLPQLNTILAITFIGISVVLVLFLLWRRIWPAGMATWYLILGLVLLLLAVALLNVWIGENLNSLLSQGTTLYIVFPLMVAVVLYFVARRDLRRGLLAALPALYMIWLLYNMESVPNVIQAVIKVVSIGLVCLTIAFLLRNTNWRTGLYIVLAMNLLVGALFSYAGVYHGGTLPSAASGPSLLEVGRSLIPQYLATSAILLGLLFAWKLRQIGRSSGRIGWFGYHLALAGLLLVILANVANLMLTTDSSMTSLASSMRGILEVSIAVGLGGYLLGVVFTYREAWFRPGIGGWVERLLMLILPLAIPVAFALPFITWTTPVSSLYGIPLLWAVPHEVSLAVGVGWMGVAVWVIVKRKAPADPTKIMV